VLNKQQPDEKLCEIALQGKMYIAKGRKNGIQGGKGERRGGEETATELSFLESNFCLI